ncbi:uncharacterized protein G2W53_024030 [Senna tora]|uniref:Uncharacterized protein n=1 Tax=Senna tora TaxID=362788 RepID=A0A834TCK3_9FABA|nr:uncharacterized protein G2W53_024030 [Senna tora]
MPTKRGRNRTSFEVGKGREVGNRIVETPARRELSSSLGLPFHARRRRRMRRRWGERFLIKEVRCDGYGGNSKKQ